MNTGNSAILRGAKYRNAPAMLATSGGVTQEIEAPMCSKSTAPRAENLTGMRFGRLTVLHRADRPPGVAYWHCVCDCGQPHIARTSHLKSGDVQSCGCLARERVSKAKATHSLTRSRAYYAWASLKQRCLNPNNEMWHCYGGRGITVCDRWAESFEAFLDDMGHPPIGTSLDRINNDEGYSPENCRWSTSAEQGQNKRNNRYLTARGETHIMAEWARIAGTRRGTISNRLRWGWSDEDAIFGRQKK